MAPVCRHLPARRAAHEVQSEPEVDFGDVESARRRKGDKIKVSVPPCRLAGNIVRAISKEDYMSAGKNASTIDHFYETLLLLKDMMKTAGGRKIVEGRHEYMKVFLAQFSSEINGLA